MQAVTGLLKQQCSQSLGYWGIKVQPQTGLPKIALKAFTWLPKIQCGQSLVTENNSVGNRWVTENNIASNRFVTQNKYRQSLAYWNLKYVQTITAFLNKNSAGSQLCCWKITVQSISGLLYNNSAGHQWCKESQVISYYRETTYNIVIHVTGLPTHHIHYILRHRVTVYLRTL